MITEPITDAATRAALHSDELLNRVHTVPKLDLSVEFARFADGLAQQVQASLTELCDDRHLVAEITETQHTAVDEWSDKVGTAHRHSLFSAGHHGHGVLVSVAVGELVAQFERILGGTGEVDPDCTDLPASAMRFAEQFEASIRSSLQRVSDNPMIASAAHGDSFEEVADFGSDERVWTADLAISSAESQHPWTIRLAATDAMVADMVGLQSVAPTKGPSIGERGLEGSAIAEVELPLRAVLVDVPMSVARLASLEPGTVIPVAVNRNVPLLTGDRTLAHGCVGELDDRVALELTQTFVTE